MLLRPAAVGLSGPRAAAAAVGLAGAVEGPVPLVAAERGDCLEGVHHWSTNGVNSKQFHNLFISQTSNLDILKKKLKEKKPQNSMKELKGKAQGFPQILVTK